MANPTATITNNLGYDVDIYDVYNNSPSNPKGLLTYTKLATVKDKAANQNVPTSHLASQLQAMRTGNIEALNKNYYVQFPVAVMPVSPFADSNAFTLTSDLQQGMEQSFQFIKFTQANPTSQLATNFRKALGDDKDTKSQETAVDAFFKGTGSFPKCTFVTWTAVVTWQAQFTSAWQGTYYLYSLGSNTAGNTTPPALVATLAIVSSASSSAVLTMAASADQKTNVVMVGDGSMHEENEGSGNLSVTLTPCWLNVPQTSQKDGKTAPTSVIGVAFTGTINGTSVAGNLNKLDLPDAPDKSKKASDKHDLAAFIIGTISAVVNTLISLGMLYIMVKDHRQSATQKKNAAQEGAADRGQAEQREAQVDEGARVDNVRQEDEARGNAERQVLEVPQRYAARDQGIELARRRNAVDTQGMRLGNVLAQGPANSNIESVATDLLKADADLKKALDLAETVGERNRVIVNVDAQLEATSGKIGKLLADSANNFNEQEEKELSDTREALNRVQAESTEAKASQKEQERENEREPSEDVNEERFEDAVPDVEGRGRL